MSLIPIDYNSASINQQDYESPLKRGKAASMDNQTEPTSLESLPQVPLDLILSKLDFRELFMLGAMSTYWYGIVTSDRVMRPIANRLGCQCNETSPTIKQLLIFISELQKKATAILDRPSNINIKGRTIKEIKDLRNWLEAIKARDILVVWKTLVREINTQIPGLNLAEPLENLLNTPQEVINKANEFSGWFTENQVVLAQLVKLDLRNKQLKLLPSEIGKLSQLKKLYLGSNQLTMLPNEISDLSQLRVLDLYRNRISSFPDGMGRGLSKLEQIDVRGNPLPGLLKGRRGLKIYQFLN